MSTGPAAPERRLTLYPVVSMITGTTPNGGGIWRHVLRERHGLLRQNRPVLVQALHFLDFRCVTPESLARWRQKPLRQHYNGNFGLDYSAEVFTDSGGFTLMFDPELDLSAYRIPRERLPEGIVDLQLDLGATRLTSLDYPVPPGLAPKEVRRRLNLTLESAVRSARRLLEREPGARGRLVVPIHGGSARGLGAFVERLFERLEREGLEAAVGGLGLGSMVPRRRQGGDDEVLAFVRAARSAMPAGLPLHVFGVSGGLIPHLAAAGTNSMDTSGYVQKARVLKYLDPATLRALPWKHLSAYPCKCRFCCDRDIAADQAVMRLPGLTGGRKSAVYAAIALHNLETEYRLLGEAEAALARGTMDAYLEALAQRFPEIRRPNRRSSPPRTTVRAHRREDYDLRRRNDFRPLEGGVCLILPCSQEKPYTASRSFGRVWKALRERLGENVARLDVVFLSGLYGPVPFDHASEPAITSYDFLLHQRDAASIAHVGKRLSDFVARHGPSYAKLVAYVSQPAYRAAVSSAGEGLELLPSSGRMGQTAFYRQENLAALVSALETALAATGGPS